MDRSREADHRERAADGDRQRQIRGIEKQTVTNRSRSAG